MNKRRSWYYAVVALGLMLVLWLSGTAVLAEPNLKGSNVSAAYSEGQAARPDEGCWVLETTQDLYSSDDGFFDTTAISANDVWAVGTYADSGLYRTLAMHWDGTLWRLVPSPFTQGWDSGLEGVAGIASNDIWAVGYSEDQSLQRTTLIMHWDGVRWSVIPSPNGAGASSALLEVAVRASNDVWAVGYSGTNVLILHWDGSQWSVVGVPVVAGNSVLGGVTALGGNNAWVVGRSYDPISGVTRTLTMRWNGSSWSVVPSPNPGPVDSTLTAVSAISSSDMWAVGYYRDESTGEPRRLSLTMRWDGTSWSVVPSPNERNGNILHDVAVISGNDVWTVGYTSQDRYLALTMHWDGGAWSIVPPAYPQATGSVLNSVDGVAGGNMRAVGYSYSSVTSRRLIMKYDPICAVPTATPTQPVPTATPTPCVAGSFSDVPPDNTFYPQVTCLANRGIVSGYSDCTFRPNNEVTRGQLAKIVSNAAGFTENPNPQIFEDVAPDNTFYQWINRLARRGHMSGYACGGVGEPCTTGRPYFRPSANATRGQTSKIISNAAGYSEIPAGQTFEDVPPTHTFYREVQRLASRSIMGGYPCGGPGEPCTTGKPYFRPANNVTRGQSAKIVANTFFPGCETE